MKKPVISPEEYANILSSITLSQILLNDSSSKKHEVKSKGGAIDLDISMKLGYGQNASEVSFITSYKLDGVKRSNGEVEKVFTIAASFQLSYMKKKSL